MAKKKISKLTKDQLAALELYLQLTAKATDTEVEFEVINLRIFVDEIEAFHIDNLNNKFAVDGVDYLNDDEKTYENKETVITFNKSYLERSNLSYDDLEVYD